MNGDFYVRGASCISKIPVDSGLTNKKIIVNGKKIAGLNTEAGDKNEGLIRFDIIFYVRMKDGLAQMIINIDYSDFWIIPINSFLGQYLRHPKPVYRNNFLIAS